MFFPQNKHYPLLSSVSLLLKSNLEIFLMVSGPSSHQIITFFKKLGFLLRLEWKKRKKCEIWEGNILFEWDLFHH